ncbi:nuclear transport factor 2 family protein [Nocardia alni]|uniref:nuclear transport factor 2 family protein n=1 Tax=Nocardia alni TaxID=2815723 RepID=UPI001C21C171|nr:nuclear transport factor 2 family protein [Nocardia alni]
MTSISPTQLLEQRNQYLATGDTEGFIGLFAPDAVIELPFAGPGMPDRIEGSAAIGEYARHVNDSGVKLDAVENVEVYESTDPEVVVVETRATGTLPTGQPLSRTSIQIFRVRDGKILLFRDFFDPRGLDIMDLAAGDGSAN